MVKFMTASEAIGHIPDDTTVCACGFVGSSIAEELLVEIEKQFTEIGHPRNLTFIHSAAMGDGDCRGANRLAHEGLLKRIVGGHFNLAPKLGQMIGQPGTFLFCQLFTPISEAYVA